MSGENCSANFEDFDFSVRQNSSNSEGSASRGFTNPGCPENQVSSRAPVGFWSKLLRDFAAENAIEAQPSQVAFNQGVARQFLASGNFLPDEISSLNIQQYLTALTKQKAPKTVRNHHAALSRFCKFLNKRGILSANPCHDLILPPVEERLPLFLDDAEVALALTLAAENGIFCEVCLALNTGLRRSELRNLTWRDISFSRRALTVIRSKSGRPRTVWLNSKALVALTEQHEHTGDCRYVFPSHRWGKMWTNAKRGIKWWAHALQPLQDAIPKFRELPKGSTGRGWHLFRHTFASRAAQAGVSIQKISKWLGHKHVSTTEIYAHLSPNFDPDIERV